MKKTTLLFCALWFAVSSYAQQKAVSINETGAAPDASSILDIQSSDKGVLFPRLTSAQRNSIANPAEGLMIYNTSRKCVEMYTGTRWTSFVPAGTVQSFAGDTTQIPEGWLLCNGAAVSRIEYSDLLQSISIAWGGGDGVNTFNLPDLRGKFPRGVDYTASNDPDVNSRTANGLGQKDNVGSLQEDAFQDHWHWYRTATDDGVAGSQFLRAANGAANSAATNQITGAYTDGINGTPRTTSETRPKNVYVNYIIKY